MEVQAEVVKPPIDQWPELPSDGPIPDEWPAEQSMRAAQDPERVTMARQVLGMLLEAGEANQETFDNCVYGLSFTEVRNWALSLSGVLRRRW